MPGQPQLKATTLANDCYQFMFNGCTNLTAAYVKAAYNASNCTSMFDGCTATGVLHTTTANEASWDAVMPSTWSSWTAVGDWND